MPFEWRVFELAKEAEHPDQNEDAWWLDAENGVAAIADGVTSGIFSRHWARILTRAAVERWPDPRDEKAFPSWLAGLRAQWEREIDTSELAWYQRAKLREGGFSTLVWLRLLDNDKLRGGEDQSRVEVMAIGDSCLFHVRDDELLESFPVEASLQFDSSPMVLGSVDLKRDDQLQFERLEISARAGDLLVLCTDAVAAWALDRQERGEPVAWSSYWNMTPQGWADEVRMLQSQSAIRYDDATLVLLRVGQVAGGRAEEHSRPDIELTELPASEEEPDVELLVADDWGDPGVSSDAPTEVISPDESSRALPETYDLQTPNLEPDPPAKADVPPPLPPGIGNSFSPPPPPAGSTERPKEDWRDQINTFSERVFKKVSDGLARGVDKLQEVKDSTVKKLREKTEGKANDRDSDSPDV